SRGPQTLFPMGDLSRGLFRHLLSVWDEESNQAADPRSIRATGSDDLKRDRGSGKGPRRGRRKSALVSLTECLCAGGS
ncbi:hypothetical protein E4U54_006805, partial [Claviceps lovelessii]